MYKIQTSENYCITFIVLLFGLTFSVSSIADENSVNKKNQIADQLEEKFNKLTELNREIEHRYPNILSTSTNTVASKDLGEGYVKDVKLINGQPKKVDDAFPKQQAKPIFFEKQQTLPNVKLSYHERIQQKIRQLITKLSTLTKLNASYTTPYIYLSGEAKIALNQKDRQKQLAELKQASLLKTDPCYRAFAQTMDTQEIDCEDYFYDRRAGPNLVVIRPGSGITDLYAMTKYPISHREFSIFCNLTGECLSAPKKAMPVVEKDEKGVDRIGIDLADVADTVDDYNTYCAYTGKCPGVYTSAQEKPVTAISYGEAQAYAQWLTKQTGFTYRLPTDEEWMHAIFASQDSLCGEMYSVAHRYHLDPNKGLANRWGLVNYLFANVHEWVDVDGEIAIRGAQIKKGREQECTMALAHEDTDFVDSSVGFRLVREIY